MAPAIPFCLLKDMYYLLIIVAAIIIFLCLQSKIKLYHKIDLETSVKNEQLRQENIKLENEYKSLQEQQTLLTNTLTNLQQYKATIELDIDQITKNSQNLAEAMYNKTCETLQLNFEQQSEKISNELEKNREEAQQEYLNTLQDCVINFEQEIKNKQDEIN